MRTDPKQPHDNEGSARPHWREPNRAPPSHTGSGSPHEPPGTTRALTPGERRTLRTGLAGIALAGATFALLPVLALANAILGRAPAPAPVYAWILITSAVALGAAIATLARAGWVLLPPTQSRALRIHHRADEPIAFWTLAGAQALGATAILALGITTLSESEPPPIAPAQAPAHYGPQ